MTIYIEDIYEVVDQDRLTDDFEDDLYLGDPDEEYPRDSGFDCE